jgi:putative ABC transport system permease protein
MNFFLTIILSNLRHRLHRSLLTVLGIAVGIGSVVTLVSVARGFERGWVRMYDARGTDLVIAKIVSKNPMPELFNESVAAECRQQPQVVAAAAVSFELMGIKEQPSVFVYGWELNTFVWQHVHLRQGRWPTNDTEKVVALGQLAAELLHANVGDKLPFDMDEFTVAGIYESPSFMENGGVVMTLPQLQRLTESPGKIRHVDLKLVVGATAADRDAVRRWMETRHPGFKAFASGEITTHNVAIRFIDAMSWATSTVAVIAGAVGVMNTMLMSVFERVREIGILLAVGWRRRRVMQMIVAESVILSVLGGLAGFGLGAVAGRLLAVTPLLRGKIEPQMSWSLLLIAMAVAVIVGVLGGLYPAWRASRLQPREAMRHE